METTLRPSRPHLRPTASVAAAALALALAPTATEAVELGWPRCQENGRVLYHHGFHALFTDLAAAVGAKEGCWQGDCTKTDKFICPSPAECATACSRVKDCMFWTYEHSITKCFMRKSDAGREEHADFVSGSRSCHPGAEVGGPGPASVALPFAQAALWAAEQPALRACDGGIGAPGCQNPYAAMAVWRYAINNLRLAVSRLPEAERAQHQSTVQYIRQIGEDVAAFYAQPVAESFQIAVGNARAVFDALAGWLGRAPAIEVEVPGEHFGAPHLPGGKSLALPQGINVGPATARAKLSDGHEMPLIGFGTWNLVGQQAYDATLAALRLGYRHIDTAQAYGNEREVGSAIKISGIPRKELYIVTKISDPREYATLDRRLESQLKDLRTDYLDLYMLHSPGHRAQNEVAWRLMEKAQAQGKIRSLGVSNFGPAELEELLSYAKVKPVYVQNKFSIYAPGDQQPGSVSMMSFAKERGIQVMGYSVINPWPLLLPPLEDPHVQAIAARNGRTASQVLHRWALQLGVAVIPKSATPSRIEENARLLDFELSELDMRLLNGLVVLSESLAGRGPSPPWADDVYGLGAAVL